MPLLATPRHRRVAIRSSRSRGVDPSTLYLALSRKTSRVHPSGGTSAPARPTDSITSSAGVTEDKAYHSCFLSYSTKDEEFAQKLHSRLRSAGITVWFSPADIQAGKKLHEQIKAGIQDTDKLLLVLSEHSMASEWVATEIRRARKGEVKEGKRKLFPIRLIEFDLIRDWECFDADTGKDLGVEVREYFIPDFSKWTDQDSFEKAFDRLLKDLKAVKAAGTGPD